MSDLISRQDAIDAVNEYLRLSDVSKNMTSIQAVLKWLPSAQERKTGRWEKSYADHEAFGVRPFCRYCSVCKEITVYPYNYCPNCGAKMEVEHE